MKLLKSFSIYHYLPSIHNKTAAERETKYSQTFIQQSPFGNGIKVTVIYAAGDRYIQVNFAENIIKATGIFWKLSSDRIYRVPAIYRVTALYIQVNFAENIIKATGNFGKLSGDRNIQGDRYIQGSYNTGLTVFHSLETKKETKSNTSMFVGITAYGDFKQGLSRLPEV